MVPARMPRPSVATRLTVPQQSNWGWRHGATSTRWASVGAPGASRVVGAAPAASEPPVAPVPASAAPARWVPSSGGLAHWIGGWSAMTWPLAGSMICDEKRVAAPAIMMRSPRLGSGADPTRIMTILLRVLASRGGASVSGPGGSSPSHGYARAGTQKAAMPSAAATAGLPGTSSTVAEPATSMVWMAVVSGRSDSRMPPIWSSLLVLMRPTVQCWPGTGRGERPRGSPANLTTARWRPCQFLGRSGVRVSAVRSGGGGIADVQLSFRFRRPAAAGAASTRGIERRRCSRSAAAMAMRLGSPSLPPRSSGPERSSIPNGAGLPTAASARWALKASTAVDVLSRSYFGTAPRPWAGSSLGSRRGSPHRSSLKSSSPVGGNLPSTSASMSGSSKGATLLPGGGTAVSLTSHAAFSGSGSGGSAGRVDPAAGDPPPPVPASSAKQPSRQSGKSAPHHGSAATGGGGRPRGIFRGS